MNLARWLSSTVVSRFAHNPAESRGRAGKLCTGPSCPGWWGAGLDRGHTQSGSRKEEGRKNDGPAVCCDLQVSTASSRAVFAKLFQD